MVQNQRSKRRIIANGFAILAVALAMWLYTNRNNKQEEVPIVESTILKVAVDVSPNGLQVDSLGNLAGKQKVLLDLLLPDRQIELVPFTNRSDALDALAAGDVQLYATSMPSSSASKLENIVATEWLYASRFSLLYSEKNSDWESKFSGDSLTTVVVSKEDQVAVTILENLAELTYPSLKVEVKDESSLQLGVKLSKGHITYLMCDSDIAESIVSVDSTLQLSHDVGFDLHQVWLINSSEDSLRLALDSAIIAQRGSKKWLKIINSDK